MKSTAGGLFARVAEQHGSRGRQVQGNVKQYTEGGQKSPALYIQQLSSCCQGGLPQKVRGNFCSAPTYYHF